MKKYLWMLMFLVLFNACGKSENENINETLTNQEVQLETEKTKENEVEKNEVEENKSGESELEIEESKTEEKELEEDIRRNGFVFSTEYTIEDYCHGCYIVSKSNGLLKGVLDKNGREILPVKYDDIWFLNADALKDGKQENLYIQTRYENDYTVIDENGKKILDKQVTCADYWFETTSENSYYFVEGDTENYKINFYRKDGSLFSSGDYLCFTDEKNFYLVSMSNEVWISENNYILTIVLFYNSNFDNDVYTVLFDKNHQMIKKWDNVSLVGQEILNNNFTFYIKDADEYLSYSIDNVGNFIENGVFQENENSLYTIADVSSYKNVLMRKDLLIIDLTESHTLGKNNDIRLYKSNNTWKLVDSKGVPLYDDRYYEYIESKDCYFLMNADNQMCLIDRNGNLLIDYEYLMYDGEKIYFMGKVLGYDNFLVGDDGVSIVFASEVYFFGENNE